MNDKPKTLGQFSEYIKEKYEGKTFSPSEIHNERVKLEKKYGEKIILGKLEDMTTDEEKMDKLEYDAMGNELFKIMPDYKKGDDLIKQAYKAQRFRTVLFARGKIIFLAILGVLIMLAVIKYLLS